MKKVISLFLAMVLMLSFSSVSAFAEEDKVVNEIHIHFPEGVSEIPVPKAGETPIESFDFVYDEKDVGLDRNTPLDHSVLKASGAVVVGNYQYYTTYWEYFYIYVNGDEGYTFPEDPNDIVFTDEKVAEALAGFTRCFPSYTNNVLILERETRTEKGNIKAEDIQIAVNFDVPKIGEEIVCEFEAPELDLYFYSAFKKDSADSETEILPGDVYEEGYIYYQYIMFEPPYRYRFEEDITADDFPDFEGFQKTYYQEDNIIEYVSMVDFTEKNDEDNDVDDDNDNDIDDDIVPPEENKIDWQKVFGTLDDIAEKYIEEQQEKPEQQVKPEHKDDSEENPNTGAPALGGFVLAAVACVLTFNKKK